MQSVQDIIKQNHLFNAAREHMMNDTGSALHDFIEQSETVGEISLLNEVIETIGYEDMTEFLNDNPGVIEAMYDWLGKQNVPEWTRQLRQAI